MDLGSCPVLHLDENFSGPHLGQLTNAIIAQPVFPRSLTVSLARIPGDVAESTSIFVPASAKVNTAIKPVLDEKPSSILGGLITEDLVWWVEGVRLDQVHLGVSSSTTEDILTLLTRHHRYRTFGPAWLLAPLPLGQDGLLQLLDFLPDLVQNPL